MPTFADATSVKPARTVFGDRRVNYLDVTFSNPYVVGGEAVTLANLGLKMGVDLLVSEIKTVGATRYRVEYDRTNARLKAINDATGAELGAVDLSGVTIRVKVEGK